MIVAVNDPGVEPLTVQVDVSLPAMLDGAQATVRPVGEDADVRSTVAAKPAVDCARIVVDAA